MKYLVFFLSSLTLAGCSQEDATRRAEAPRCDGDGVVVSDAWIRAADASRPATAAYLTLCNAGDGADALIGAASAAAASVEIHETTRTPDGVARMAQIERLTLAPDAPVTLAPGGAHIMLIGLTEGLAAGSTATLTLEFERGPPMTIEAEVRDAAGGAGDHH